MPFSVGLQQTSAKSFSLRLCLPFPIMFTCALTNSACACYRYRGFLTMFSSALCMNVQESKISLYENQTLRQAKVPGCMHLALQGHSLNI